MSRRTNADGPPSARRRAHGTEFAAVDNQIHFHPDPRLGGFAILVLLRRSALRPAGVHLFDGGSRTWSKAADVDQFPQGTWVRLRDEGGRALPVEVLRTTRAMCVRWLSPDGEPVEPSSWDRARTTLARAAMAESSGQTLGFEGDRFALARGCTA